jgi:hypothetical protein
MVLEWVGGALHSALLARTGVDGRLEGSRFVVPRRTRDICLGACLGPQVPLNRRLPGAFQRGLGMSAGSADEEFPRDTMGKRSRAVVRGSRPFNTLSGLPRSWRERARSLGDVPKRLPSKFGARRDPSELRTRNATPLRLGSATPLCDRQSPIILCLLCVFVVNVKL